MSLEKSGESMSIVVRLFFILGVLALLTIGCGSDPDPETVEVDSPPEGSLSPKDAELAALLNDVLVRLSYEDKSGLYEMEFDYFLDEFDFDHYVKRADIQWIHMDSLDHLAVDSIWYYGDDSARAKVEYVFNSSDGGQTRLPDVFTIIRSNGRWVKPTITRVNFQDEYDQAIRDAEAAADEEN